MTTRDLQGASDYINGGRSFLAGIRPQDALAVPLEVMLDVMRQRIGVAVDVALSPDAVDLSRPLRHLPTEVTSPRAAERDSSWLKRSNMVGVNVRTVADYGGVLKYALTLPAAFDSIHLLPIWEPGVVESLYGIAGWGLNNEFYSRELQTIAPHLDTIDLQLRATSNLLHAMGKTIGMDVIPHTDRFSEPALANPDLFEWMRVRDREIVDHSDGIISTVVEIIFEWLVETGSASPDLSVPTDTESLFALSEPKRLQILFGEPGDLSGRIDRRVDLIRRLKLFGLEPVPATMGVPYRGIKVDADAKHVVVDDHGMEWPDFVMTSPEYMSRVFSPLARFKFYERLNDNADWEINFSQPRDQVWRYVCDHYARAQHIGNFDFMRGDMSHVQMRPDGVPDTIDDRYDILAAVKSHIQQKAGAPWFGYFAETFLPPRDSFQFGEELDHLEASLADVTLGDLQSTVVGSPSFLRRFRRYLDDLATRRTAPAFGVMTADKDDPRFDEFYRSGNEARLFTALFLTDMPSYTGLGFEIRDVHWEPADNEHYTKLFVFREKGDSNVYPSKARHRNEFIWGENEELFEGVTALRVYAEGILDSIAASTTRWLIPPDATTHRGIAAWTQAEKARYVFAVNYDTAEKSGYFGLPALPHRVSLGAEFSTHGTVPAIDRLLVSNGFFHRVENLAPGEGRVYRVRAVD